MTLIVAVPNGTPSQLCDLDAQGQNPLRGQVQLLTPEMLVPRLTFVAWNGASTLTVPVLAAGHTPGLYVVPRFADRAVSGSGGTFATATNFNDPIGGLTQASGVGGLLFSGVLGAIIMGSNSGFITLLSDGSGPISTVWTPTAAAGGPVINTYQCATLLGTL